jgi:GNAT superfamily N-acetyltransferase
MNQCDGIIYRKSRPEDVDDYYALIMLAASDILAALWGDKTEQILKGLFLRGNNIFSHEHVIMVEVKGKIAAMNLCYGWRHKREQNSRTGLMIYKMMGGRALKYYFVSRKLKPIDILDPGEYYNAYGATYPEYSGRGIGRELLNVREKIARESRHKRIISLVDKGNDRSIRMFLGAGYKIEKHMPPVIIGGVGFDLCKVSKPLDHADET